MRLKEDANAETISDCFLVDYVQKMKEEKNNSNTIFTEDQFVVTYSDLMQAGSETTGNFLTYAVLLLSTHAEIQNRMYQEILAVIGKMGCLTMANYKM